VSTNGSSGDVTLFVDPFSNHFLEDRLFDMSTGAFSGDDIQAPWVYLRDWFRERGVAVYTADRLASRERGSAVNAYISLGLQKHCRELARRDDVTMSAFFAFEGPIVDPVLYRNLSWVKDCVKRVYSFSNTEALAPFLKAPLELEPFCVTYPFDGVDEEAWSRSDRGFLVMINGNRLPRLFVDELYTERVRALAFFEATGEIDLYGMGWEHPPFRPYPAWVPFVVQRTHRKLIATKHRFRPDHELEAARRVYRGSTPRKSDTLSRYTFALCYENQILDGWITEKMFDCFRAGTVPVYWGAPDIEDYVPAECYVDRRRFASYEDLRDGLRSMSPREIQEHREAARDFFASERFYPFSKQAFVDRLAGILEEDTGLRLR
jgi:alpha(1,3/1,4) fucosyltransferase